MLPNSVRGPADIEPTGSALEGGVRLLYIGRLSPGRGHRWPSLPRACSPPGYSLRARAPGSVFPGYEWFAQELQDTVHEAGLSDAVRFAGFEPDVWPRVGWADVVLVPSTVDEPFGNTAVEAVLAARPLVVSATSGLLEAAAGYASAHPVPPGDAEAIADAVEAIVADWSDQQAAAVADSAVAAERHSPERVRPAGRAALQRARSPA